MSSVDLAVLATVVGSVVLFGGAVVLAMGWAFRAGQFAELNPAGTDVWRSYSMANPPSAPSRAEFMIKAIPGGAFSTRLEATNPGDRFTVRGPLGSFWVRDHDRPLLLLVPGLLATACLFLYPFLYGLQLSFAPRQGGVFANYARFFSDPYFAAIVSPKFFPPAP